MFSKNQVIVFTISFLIAGFFLLSKPDSGFSGGGPLGCCQFSVTCTGDIEEIPCLNSGGEDWCEGGMCEASGLCRCPVVPPQIPTLNEWGKIITIVVIGLFALIGIFAMRRRSKVTTSN